MASYVIFKQCFIIGLTSIKAEIKFLHAIG